MKWKRRPKRNLESMNTTISQNPDSKHQLQLISVSKLQHFEQKAIFLLGSDLKSSFLFRCTFYENSHTFYSDLNTLSYSIELSFIAKYLSYMSVKFKLYI